MVKHSADNESQSRKNVRLSSTTKNNVEPPNVNPNEECVLIHKMNQFIQMADSPKMYANENIISQPKLAASIHSNKSDVNTVKAQSPGMQLQNVEHSEYAPDSDPRGNLKLGKQNSKAQALL